MRLLTFVILLFITSTTFSATYMKGIILKKLGFSAVMNWDLFRHNTPPFPLKNYTISGVTIGSLEYDETYPINDKRIDLNKYKVINAGGSLDLESYNEKTGEYKFKMILFPKNIEADIAKANFSDEKIQGKIKINSYHEVYFEGTFDSAKNTFYPNRISKINYSKLKLVLSNTGIDFIHEENIPVSIQIE